MYPVLFQLGPVTIYSFGFFLILAYLVATSIFWKEGKRQGYAEEKLLDLSLLALIGAFIGSRIFFVLVNLEIFRKDFLTTFYFWEGGLSFFGAAVGVLVVGYIFLRRWKWTYLQAADFGALAGLVAYVIIKIGAYLSGIDYGTFTSLPWGVEFPEISGARHPVQLYEAVMGIILFVLLKRGYEKNLGSVNFSSGKTFLWAVFALSLSRFFFDFFRANLETIGNVRVDQIISFLVAIGAISALYYLRLRDARADLEIFLRSTLSVNNRVLRKLKFW